MSIEVREALSSEVEVLLHFEAGIIEAERPFDSTLKSGEIHYYDLLEMIESDKATVIVAEIDGEIVGSGYAKILNGKDYQAFDQYAYLGFMFVKPTFRGQGINKKIIDYLIEWSKSKNISEVRLQVYDANAIAKNSYIKTGFKPVMLEMRMEL